MSDGPRIGFFGGSRTCSNNGALTDGNTKKKGEILHWSKRVDRCHLSMNTSHFERNRLRENDM